MSASRDTPYLPLQSPLIRKAIALHLRKHYILLSSKAMAYFPLQDSKSFGIRQIQVQSSSWPLISSATLNKLLSSSEPLHKREEAAEIAPISYEGWGGKERHRVKPDDAPVNIKLDTKWSHFKETSKAKEPILSRCKSRRDFIQGVNCFLTVISLPTPECSGCLRTQMFLSADCPQLSQPHESPTRSPVTYWDKVVIHQMLKAQHQTQWKVALGFYCTGISFPCLQPLAQYKALHCLQMGEGPGLFFLLTFSSLHH